MDEYGWRPEQSRWIIGASDWYMPPFDFIPQPHPAAVDVQPIPHGQTLSDMLDRGELDAAISARAPRCFMEGSRNVARLFPDYAQVEREYYKRTGIFPIMHTLVVRKELISRQAEIATAIYKGFSQAKDLVMQRYKSGMVEQNVKSLVPWLTPLLEANSQMFPEDWWPYGIAANRLAIETFARYFFEQGLGKKLRSVDELFPVALSATDFPNS
jgi:4,5-dihydroxyphthalate decarboxylase